MVGAPENATTRLRRDPFVQECCVQLSACEREAHAPLQDTLTKEQISHSGVSVVIAPLRAGMR